MSVALSLEAESVLGVTTERFAHCRLLELVLSDFLAATSGSARIQLL